MDTLIVTKAKTTWMKNRVREHGNEFNFIREETGHGFLVECRCPGGHYMGIPWGGWITIIDADFELVRKA
jgi:hypothetical protein